MITTLERGRLKPTAEAGVYEAGLKPLDVRWPGRNPVTAGQLGESVPSPSGTRYLDAKSGLNRPEQFE
jgi:hypothetical protein